MLSITNIRFYYIKLTLSSHHKNCILQLKIRREQNYKGMLIELKMNSMHLGNDLIHDKKTGKLILYMIEKNWFGDLSCVCVWAEGDYVMVLRTFGIKIIITVVTSTNYEHCSSLDKVQVQNEFFSRETS